jgi:hypothetical protein
VDSSFLVGSFIGAFLGSWFGQWSYPAIRARLDRRAARSMQRQLRRLHEKNEKQAARKMASDG